MAAFTTRKEAIADAQEQADFSDDIWFVNRVEPGPIWSTASVDKSRLPGMAFNVTKTIEVRPLPASEVTP